MNETTREAPRTGLDGVVVADTRLSSVDGERGELIVAGLPIEILAERLGFEAAAQRLWTGREGSARELAELRVALGRGRLAAHGALGGMTRALDEDDAMAALRSGASMLAPHREPAELVGGLGVIAAAHGARRAGRAPLAPDPEAPHARDLLRLLTGREVEPARARALERYLVTVMDHGMNASTFAARVVASTGADDRSALVAAIGALSGPLHGGAPGPVLDMLDAVGDGDAEAWLERELAAGRRIMGMGHRIYRVRDPRVVVLERAAEELRREGLGSARLEIARRVEAAAERLLARRYPDRALKANVELATAVLLDAIGVPRALFSALFACGRAVGWLAHVAEQRATGRLIRPESRYVGPREA